MELKVNGEEFLLEVITSKITWNLQIDLRQ